MQNKNIIEVLPPSVVEKIAAGEVVERPASVLKELVENSIDAGATRIDVVVEDAGFAMMRVSDNGCGMSREDIGRSVLPHATSKIRSADDLYSIATMGFRGEALASISAVSRMSLTSSDGEADGLGYEITVEGGVHGEVVPAPRARGTTITVRDLFYNVPARKKFMKSPRGEQMAIVKILEQLAVPFPGIHFTVSVDGRKTLNLPAAATLRERICSVAGNDFAAGLVECGGDGDGMSVLAYVSTPEKLQAKPRFQSLYVNLRRIDNDSVTFAVRQAFAQYLGHGNKPSFFCFLDVDPERTDVNVHPTKQQMKFDNDRVVFSFIYHTVTEGLRRSEVAREDLAAGDFGGGGDIILDIHDSGSNISNGYGKNGLLGYDNGNNIPVKYGNNGLNEYDNGNNIPNRYGSNMPNIYDIIDIGVIGGAVASESQQSAMSQQASPELSLYSQQASDVLTVIGEASEAGAPIHQELIQCYQIHGMFILAQIKNGILLIDQHAAHERVIYEQALADMEAGRPVSQQLLFPIVFEMSVTEKSVIESGREYFNNLGFEISDFGGNSVSVSALPTFLKDSKAEESIREMARYLLEGRDPEEFKEPQKRFAAAFACGAAIKFGQKLSQEEMNALINALFSANNPYTCPHGRPTLVRISVDELRRRFLRP